MLKKIVLCMRWGTLYGPDYVNVLFNACKRNISGDFRFVCLTDDNVGLLDDIESYPIPDIGCTTEMWFSGAWPKLAVFAKNLYGIEGRALFIDMDSVVWGGLDKFFELEHDFVAIDTSDNWRPGIGLKKHRPLVGTGVFSFNIGAHSNVLSDFTMNPRSAFQRCGLEQVWVQERIEKINFWPDNWVISYKRWLRQPLLVDLFLPPKTPTSEVGIVAFHGNPRPINLINKEKYFWDNFPHLGHGAVGWLREYWLSNGGRDFYGKQR